MSRKGPEKRYHKSKRRRNVSKPSSRNEMRNPRQEQRENIQESSHRNEVKTQISRRQALIAALLAGGVVAEELSVGAIRKSFGGESDEGSVEENATPELREELAPYVNPNFQLIDAPATQKAIKEQYYPLYHDPEQLVARLNMYQHYGIEGNNPDQDRNMDLVIKRVLGTGIVEDLQKLKESNSRNKKKARIIIVPQIHGIGSAESYDSNPVLDCASDIANILRILNKNPKKPKIFDEGSYVQGRVTLDSWAEAMAKEWGPGETPPPVEFRKRMVMEMVRAKKHEWNVDPAYNVYGMEHDPFFLANSSIVSDFARLGGERLVGPYFTGFYLSTVNGFLREQYCIEKVIQTLEEGETGVIVMGTAHLVSMQRYMQEDYPEISFETLVPKHLELG
jgi:hypothetical protein